LGEGGGGGGGGGWGLAMNDEAVERRRGASFSVRELCYMR
jgi:hypothetical protein